MKKALAILLVAVHLLNLVGGYGLFERLAVIYEDQFSDQLDNDEYSGSDAITLRLPIGLPYPSSNTNYQRTEGKVLLEGEVYQLVKQKIHNDILYLVCVKDNQSNELRAKLLDYSAALGDQSPTTNSKGKTANISITDFDAVGMLCLSNSAFLLNPIQFSEYSFSEKLNSDFTVDQPPRI